MFVISCYNGLLGMASDRSKANDLWAEWCSFFHRKAQSTRGTEDYNHWVKSFNTLAITEK